MFSAVSLKSLRSCVCVCVYEQMNQYFWALLIRASLSISSSPYLCWSSRSLSICRSTSSRRAWNTHPHRDEIKKPELVCGITLSEGDSQICWYGWAEGQSMIKFNPNIFHYLKFLSEVWTKKDTNPDLTINFSTWLTNLSGKTKVPESGNPYHLTWSKTCNQ